MVPGVWMYGRAGDVTVRDLGRVLKERRETLGMSQGDIADRLDVTQSYVSAWELGKVRRITFEMLRKLSRAYEIDIDVLARASGYALPVEQRPAPDLSQERLAALLPPGLNQKQIEAVAAYAQYLKAQYWLENDKGEKAS